MPRDDQRHQAIGSQYKRRLKVIKKKQEEEIAVSFVEEEVVQQETTLLPSSALKQPSSMRRQKFFQILSFICNYSARKAVWCLKPEVQFLPNLSVSYLEKVKWNTKVGWCPVKGRESLKQKDFPLWIKYY